MPIDPPMSEWLKVMLEEIARKRADVEQARAEQLRRRDERGAHVRSAADGAVDGPVEQKRR